MHWSSYEVFSVLSGVILFIAAFIAPFSVRDRLGMGFGGVFLVGYGFYVANQTSGTYEFPVQIFLIPFAAIGYGLYKAYQANTKKS